MIDVNSIEDILRKDNTVEILNILERAIYHGKELQKTEEELHKLVPTRKVHFVDVGDMPPEKAKEFMELIRKSYVQKENLQ